MNKYVEGREVGEIWGLETIGIAKSENEMQAHLLSLPNGGQDAIGSKWSAGDIMYRDLNEDGKISKSAGTLDDHGDLKVIGNSTPRYFFGIDLNADWKGFDIRLFFQGVMKRDFGVQIISVVICLVLMELKVCGGLVDLRNMRIIFVQRI